MGFLQARSVTNDSLTGDGRPYPAPFTPGATMAGMTSGHAAGSGDLFTAIDHVGIAVPDLDEAIGFYEKTFGMRLAHEEVNEEQGVREAMMTVGDPGDRTRIQLLAPLSAGLDDREVPRPLRPRRAAGRLPGRRPRRGQRDAARARRAPAVRRPQARHLGLPGQLHPPQGRRRRARRARRPATDASRSARSDGGTCPTASRVTARSVTTDSPAPHDRGLTRSAVTPTRRDVGSVTGVPAPLPAGNLRPMQQILDAILAGDTVARRTSRR